MTEGTLSVAARRMRRQRRLAQRLRTNGYEPIDFARQLAPAMGVVGLGIAIGLLTLLARGLAPAAEDAAPPAANPAPERIRPGLEPAGAPSIPLPIEYVVLPGDTLLSVAYKFGSSVEAIRLASDLESAHFLRPGWMLTVPPAGSVLLPIEPDVVLRDLVETHEVEAWTLAFYNGIWDDQLDEPLGRSLLVLPPPLDLASPPLAPSRGIAAGESSDPEPIVYTVLAGDTVLDIAARLGVDPDALVAANRLDDSDWIVAGDRLAVPIWARPAREVTPVPAIAQETTPPSGAALAQPQERPKEPIVYELAPGDTLHDVAGRFGIDVYTIMNNNDLADADLVRAGTQITILPVSGLTYTVEPDDTLAGIAQKFKVDLGPIIDFNYLEDVDFIAVGMELILPGAAPLPPPPAPAPRGPITYEVAVGDTVAAIARRFGVESADIVAANGLRSADRIAVGDNLKILAGAAPGRSGPAVAAAAPRQETVTRNLPVPQAPPAAAARPVAPGGGGNLASVAMRYQGSRYVWGGTTPAGFDCSGFVYYVQSQAGRSVPRGLWGQYNAGSHPSRGELLPGDIVFFQNTYMAGLSHNGIYIGGGQFIHASDERSGVKISSLSESYWASRWFGATRAW